MEELSGKTAVITGAASGIGAGIAEAFADAGIRLALLDVEEDRLRRVARRVGRNGPAVRCFVVDVSYRAAMKRTAADVAAAFPTVHILCNNAGVGYTGVPMNRVPDEDWNWVLGVNLMGVINGLQAFLPLLQGQSESGHIVNTASIGGHRAMPGWQYGLYVTSKFAVVGLSEALADDLSEHGIGVSVLCPAAVDTAIYEIGRNRPARFGGPFELAVDPDLTNALREGTTPVEIGRWVIRAILDDRFYIFPHPHTRDFIVRRHERLMAAYDWAARVAPDVHAAASGERT